MQVTLVEEQKLVEKNWWKSLRLYVEKTEDDNMHENEDQENEYGLVRVERVFLKTLFPR